jgi:hypothetical protein
MKMSGNILLFILILGGVCAPRCGATVYYSNGSAASVQALQNAALDGDTIVVPSGTFNWTSGVRISKSITLRGAGMDSTVITGDNITLVDLQTSSSTVTGIHFILSYSSGAGVIIIADGQNFRVHDNKFENGGPYHIQIGVLCTGSKTRPHPTGVIDHNQFFNCKFLVQGNSQECWHQASKIGNPDQTGVVYLEDNYFYENIGGGGYDAADSDNGGRYVFRYNEVHNCQVEVHSLRGARGGRSCEVYNNTFIRDIDGDQFTAIWPRAGTGVIYNNTMTGHFDYAVVMDNVRSFIGFGYPPGSCDGTSNWDGDQSGKFGWPCRDQIGRGADQYLWTTAPYPPQLSEPLYLWNNTLNGSPGSVLVGHNGSAVKPRGSSADIVAGRDYITGARPNYTPYTYPHPLIH